MNIHLQSAWRRMSLTEMAVQTIRRLLAPFRTRLNPRYYRDPRSYWERRHRRAGTTLDGVGLLGLGAEGNARDYDEKWSHVAAALARLGPGEERSLLDAGCGIGWFSVRAADLGFRVDGVDFSPAAIETARSSVDSEIGWHVSDLHAFRPGRRYDIVMCIDVLFHVVDDDAWSSTIRNLASLVERGGRLLIQEQLGDRGAAPIDPSRTHVRQRTQRDYLDALKGWRLLKRDTYTLPAQGTRKDLMLFARGVGLP